METKPLHYFKCVDCLTPVTSHERRSTFACDCGGSTFKYMGEVLRDRTVVQGSVCKCNEVCVHATGPNCNCECGGTNHGLGMLGYEKIGIVTGKAVFGVKCKDKAKAHGAWYREHLAKFEAYRASRPTMNIDYDFIKVTNALVAISQFKKARTVKKRENLVKKIEGLVKIDCIPQATVA